MWSKPQLASRSPIRAPGHRLHPICMSGQRLAHASAFHIPQLDGGSQLALASMLPSGAKASPNTQLVCPVRIAREVSGCVSCSSQSRMPHRSRHWRAGSHRDSRPGQIPGRCGRRVSGGAYRCRIPEPDGRIISSTGQHASIGGKGEASDIVVCQPDQSNAPLSTSHTLTLPSQLPVASVRPSGLKARARTVSVCACQVRCRASPLRATPILPLACCPQPSTVHRC